ncbi:MAG: hypothetical protein RDV41_11705 [Planctomycetota bacterium]|nr:hypothetical protein [Planctomycetota bacterium]
MADRLIEGGCDYRRLRITSGGMTAPDEKNENLLRNHLNRRVEVLQTDALMPD